MTSTPPSAAPSLREAFPRLARQSGRRVRSLERLQLEAREFADTHVRPIALETDRRADQDPSYFNWDIVRAGARHGMIDLLVPAPAGGAGGLAVQCAIVMEELCAACPGIANIFGAHALGIAPL